MIYIGYGVIGLGMLLTLIGIAGAALSFAGRKPAGWIEALPNIATVLKEIGPIIKEILTAPQWLLAVGAGLGLIYFGIKIINGTIV